MIKVDEPAFVKKNKIKKLSDFGWKITRLLHQKIMTKLGQILMTDLTYLYYYSANTLPFYHIKIPLGKPRLNDDMM